MGGCFSKSHKGISFRILIGGCLMGLLALSCISEIGAIADLDGASDHPILKRFAGSEIVGYDVKRFDQYELQTSTYKVFNMKANKREFISPPLKIEGAYTQIWYESAGVSSATEIIRNYQNELKEKGFEILYNSADDPNATKWINFLAPFSFKKISTSRSHYIFYAADEKTLKVTSARLQRPEGDVYVYLTAVDWSKDNPTYKAKKGAYIAVDIIETGAMVQNMVLVKADEMSQSIRSSGRVALYGILFDSNKTDIKPESRPALEEIAKLLQNEPELKLHVVGHTDNTGGLDFNFDLSKKRAEAVVAALMKEFGISASRLISNGVAYLAPVATNTTEEGRAKNRRVELVPQ